MKPVPASNKHWFGTTELVPCYKDICNTEFSAACSAAELTPSGHMQLESPGRSERNSTHVS